MKSYPRSAHNGGVELVISNEHGQVGVILLTREEIYLHMEAFVRGFRTLDLQDKCNRELRERCEREDDHSNLRQGGGVDHRARYFASKGAVKGLGIVLALMLLCVTAQAGQIGDWYKSLRQPGTGVSCCDAADCGLIDDKDWRIVDGNYEVMLTGQWVPVPEDKVLHRSDNPTGRGVLCIYGGKVLCFDPGPLS